MDAIVPLLRKAAPYPVHSTQYTVPRYTAAGAKGMLMEIAPEVKCEAMLVTVEAFQYSVGAPGTIMVLISIVANRWKQSKQAYLCWGQQ